MLQQWQHRAVFYVNTQISSPSCKKPNTQPYIIQTANNCSPFLLFLTYKQIWQQTSMEDHIKKWDEPHGRSHNMINLK